LDFPLSLKKINSYLKLRLKPMEGHLGAQKGAQARPPEALIGVPIPILGVHLRSPGLWIIRVR
jgi:hypothetical protein